ncbi:hypothetical protein Cgig2_013133 [Carnegiea gigantea]|uniref:Zinc knuckle CX2CX4HX4C domain-containing protein n=1 Tax=Carnegiea gigantea TaxID=171969 RepID=A0A9Q1KMP8_9CARY|nr:hypothetical protein Cgig2_013133 [Carnegiea gigantea]
MASIDSPLMNRWKYLKLTEHEEKIVECSNTSASDFSARACLALTGKEDKARVLQGGPWIFDKQLILLAEVDENMVPSEVQFVHVSFCVRKHDILFEHISQETARALTAHFGGLVEYRGADALGWSRYVAFRVKVNIHEPLLRGVIASFGDAAAKWIPFKYERLPSFYYRCGRLSHVEDDCDRSKGGTKDSMEIGLEHHQRKPTNTKRMRITSETPV